MYMYLYYIHIITKLMMDEDDDAKLIGSNSWHIEDLDGGLVNGISNLHGLGNRQLLEENTPAYDMTGVLQLPIFKHEVLNSTELLQSLNNSLQDSISATIQDDYTNTYSPSFDNGNSAMNQMTNLMADSFLVATNLYSKALQSRRYNIYMRAPTAPGRKINEKTLTWLNQGQAYEVVLELPEEEKKALIPGKPIKVAVSIGFYERQYQYFETNKYEEWCVNRPDCKMIELDIPMCMGVMDVMHVGQYTNEIEFRWDPVVDAHIFVKVNCLSSEFTKTKSGESGVLLRLQLDVYDQVDLNTASESLGFSAGCQVKVFRAKGANRKLKLELEKHESLLRKDSDSLQSSRDITMFEKLEEDDRVKPQNVEMPIKIETWLQSSPTSGNHSNQGKSCNGSLSSTPRLLKASTLTASSTMEETEAWLRNNRFHKYCGLFASFSGDDLLRLSREDLIQLCGPADGIRLNNTLQARASRPLLTMYVSPEWHQTETGMREYHAMFLEQLDVAELKRKLAKKCGIKEENISAFLKQGPTGIHIHVDDEVVRNFVDEAHHVVEVLDDPLTGLSKILLK